MRVLFKNDERVMDFEREFTNFNELVEYLDELYAIYGLEWKRSSIEVVEPLLPGKTLVGWRYFISDYQNAQGVDQDYRLRVEEIKAEMANLEKVRDTGEINAEIFAVANRILSERMNAVEGLIEDVRWEFRRMRETGWSSRS